jgi:RsiG-like
VAGEPCGSLTPHDRGAITERVQRLLESTYLEGLDSRALDELRAMHVECAETELALSYFRRLAQARVEILEAERARRERGGSVGDLVADLPRILSAESGRSTIATTRGAPATDPPTIELRWPDHRENLVVDTTLANLPGLALDELVETIEALHDFERELSDLRTQMHRVIDAIDRVIVDRRVAGTAG